MEAMTCGRATQQCSLGTLQSSDMLQLLHDTLDTEPLHWDLLTICIHFREPIL